MNQEQLLDYIVDEIVNIIKKNPNKEFNLNTLIKNIKRKKSLLDNIETHKIYKKIQNLNNLNKEYEIITYQNTDNKYIILSRFVKKLNSDNEEALEEALKIEKEKEALKIEKEKEALKIEKETRTILYSSLIVVSLLVYNYLSKNLHIDVVVDIIKFCIILCSFILLKTDEDKSFFSLLKTKKPKSYFFSQEKEKNNSFFSLLKTEENNSFLFLFLTLSSIMILEIKNSIAIFLFIGLLILLKKCSKIIKYNGIVIKLIMGLVFFICVVLLYALSQYYIGPIDYIILNIILISLLILNFFSLNRFNVLQALVFFAISFSSYSLINNLMKMLNEKNFIFHPYNDVNIQLSLLSISIAILIFTNTSIAIFFENVLTTINKKKSYILLKCFFSSCLLALVFGNMISGLNGMSVVITLLFIIIISFLFMLIYVINLNDESKYRPSNFINFEKNLFNCQNEPKTIIWLKNFLKPLNKNNDIIFDLKIYKKNILFSFLSLYIIFKFILSYQDIFHYTQNNITCTNIEDGRLIYEIAGEDFVYSLYNDKESINLLKISNDMNDKLKNLNNSRKTLYSRDSEKIKKSLENLKIEKKTITENINEKLYSSDMRDLKILLTEINARIKVKEINLRMLNNEIDINTLNEEDKVIYEVLKSRENKLKNIDNEIDDLTKTKIKIYTGNNFKVKYSYDELINNLKQFNFDGFFKESQYATFKEFCKKI